MMSNGSPPVPSHDSTVQNSAPKTNSATILPSKESLVVERETEAHSPQPVHVDNSKNVDNQDTPVAAESNVEGSVKQDDNIAAVHEEKVDEKMSNNEHVTDQPEIANDTKDATPVVETSNSELTDAKPVVVEANQVDEKVEVTSVAVDAGQEEEKEEEEKLNTETMEETEIPAQDKVKPESELKPESNSDLIVEPIQEDSNEITAKPEPSEEALDSDAAMPSHQQKYCISMLRSLKKLKDGGPFSKPVDAIKLNIPSYYTIITNPMDMSKIESKLLNNEYKSVEEFEADFRLIIQNCVTFNGETNPITAMARNLESTFEKQLKRMPPRSLPPKPSPAPKATPLSSKPSTPVAAGPTKIRPKREIHPPPSKDLPWHTVAKPKLRKKDAADLRFAASLVRDVQKKQYEQYVYPFVHKVDAIALNIPEYYNVIKEPMELITIENKLRQNEYKSPDEFVAEMNLIFSNCFKFNPSGTPVNQMGQKFKALFEEKWKERPSLQRDQRPSMEDTDEEVEVEVSVEEESSSEEESEEESDLDPGMTILQKQMALLQQQMEEISRRKKSRKSHDGKKSKSSKSKKSKKSSGGDSRRVSSSAKAKSSSSKSKKSTPIVKKVVLTREQKAELSELMQNLDGNKVDGVLEIIKETEKIDVSSFFFFFP